MYHPTEMANTLTPTSWFYSLHTHTSSNQNHRDYPSRLEISLLLDSGASISVLNRPTYLTIAKLLNIKQNPPQNSSKTLTVANQTEVPVLHYITITLKTTVEDNSRQFTIQFGVADFKYNILGTPFFEENIQNINIQDFILQFKHHSREYPNSAKFTSLLSKDYTYSSYIYRINSKTQIRLKPNSSEIAHFPIFNYYNLHFSTTPQKQFFPTIPHTYFSSKFLQLSTLSKSFQMTNQILVQQSYKTLQITLQHYLQDTLVILKSQKLMKNPNITKSMTLSRLYTMLLIHTTQKLQNLSHQQTIQHLQNNKQYFQHNFY